jgi:hypothetical protein
VGTPTPTGPLTAELSASLPPAVVGGMKAKKARARVAVTNMSSERVSGPVTIGLFLSADATLDAGDAAVTSSVRRLTLKPGQTKTVRMHVREFPAVADGAYHLMAQVTGPAGGGAVASGAPVLTVAAPFVDLTGSFARGVSGTVRPTGKTSATLLVRNAGNISAHGPGSVALYASSDTTLDPSADTPLVTRALRLNLKPGGARAYPLRFALPANLATGSHYLAASVDSANQVTESNEANNDAISTAPFTVSPT